jgi:hypothetical protein
VIPLTPRGEALSAHFSPHFLNESFDLVMALLLQSEQLALLWRVRDSMGHNTGHGRFLIAAFGTALLLSAGVPVPAMAQAVPRHGDSGRWGQPGWGGSSEGYRTGYDVGVREGERDARDGKDYGYKRDDAYEEADYGYRGGSRNEYRRLFRQGYEAGYDAGYRRYAGGRYGVIQTTGAIRITGAIPATVATTSSPTGTATPTDIRKG